MDLQTANTFLEHIQSEFSQVPVVLHEVTNNHHEKRGFNIVFHEGTGSQAWTLETPAEVEHWIMLARLLQQDTNFFEHPQNDREVEWADSVRLVLRDKPEED